MSQKNDFKAFSISNNANVVSQEKYEENQSLQVGFPPDNISTHVLNKALRQSSTIATVIANFIATQSGDDVLDDGDIAKLTSKLNQALKQKVTAEIPDASLTQKGVVQLTNEIGNNDTLAVTQKLVQEIINSLRGNIDGKVSNSRKINGKALIEDINLNASDVGAYTRTEVDKLIKTTSEIPVGAPIPWPLAHPPIGYFTCNGSTFNKLQYPKLAEAYPNGRLPDLRGEFIRGWDDGRGVDPGRILLTNQSDALQDLKGSFKGDGEIAVTTEGVFANGGAVSGKYGAQNDNVSYKTLFDASRVARTSHETRPRNIAFNYIVKAE
ncbi:DNA-packaging protein [Photorhabdus sp. HUG-39]|uniref:DNA-packaging protein n=1 Tax=Photorhabdus kayaii TaxID=230088 RepID=A0ABX0B2B8_9GAMM|nr:MULTISPECIES: tail fiber protein [Photorhabdus]MCC8376768.1 tail fiber protein [Photorhabdus bodei]NDL13256.1 DNA-packaging protein [Photorhabdus kayaii]NDL26985.1 DNA-packaging protein [Photorhabdus kayaii]RAX08124.1 DNA-packaging protein [Photorhabdus sp. HUG-39]